MMEDLYNALTTDSSLFDILNFNLALQKISCCDRHPFTYMRGKTIISSLLLLLFFNTAIHYLTLIKSEYTCYDTFNAATMTYYLIQFHFDGKIKSVTLNVNLLNLTCKCMRTCKIMLISLYK